MSILKHWKSLGLLLVLSCLFSCEGNQSYNDQPKIIEPTDVKEYWHLDGLNSYWEISHDGTVNFLSCSVDQKYVKDMNVTGYLDNDLITIKTNQTPTLNMTSSNNQMVILGIDAVADEITLEIPAHTLVDKIPKHCTDSVVDISTITIDVNQPDEAEVSVDIAYHLHEASAEVFAQIVPQTSTSFERPQEATLKIQTTGSGSETIKIVYKPENDLPHFLYVMLVPEQQSDTDIENVNPYLVDIEEIEF